MPLPPSPPVIGLLATTAKALQAQLGVALGLPHYGESGRAIEDTLREVLAQHLPSRFALKSGFAVGTDGQYSNQSDILVVDTLASPVFLTTPGAGIYPADGVLGCIEATRNLDLAKLKQDTQKLTKFSNLVRALTYVDYDTRPVTTLVGATSAAGIQSLGQHLKQKLLATPPENRKSELPHGVLILDEGLICYGIRSSPGRQIVVSFNPRDANEVYVFQRTPEHLALFLHLLTNEFGHLLEHRAGAAGAHILMQLDPMLRTQLAQGGAYAKAHHPQAYAKLESLMPAAIMTGHIVRFAYYFDASVDQLVQAHMKAAP